MNSLSTCAAGTCLSWHVCKNSSRSSGSSRMRSPASFIVTCPCEHNVYPHSIMVIYSIPVVSDLRALATPIERNSPVHICKYLGQKNCTGEKIGHRTHFSPMEQTCVEALQAAQSSAQPPKPTRAAQKVCRACCLQALLRQQLSSKSWHIRHAKPAKYHCIRFIQNPHSHAKSLLALRKFRGRNFEHTKTY